MSAAPGWYPDGRTSTSQRWWDGQAWSDHVWDPTPAVPKPAVTAPYPQQAVVATTMRTTSRRRLVWIGLGLLAAVLFGAFLLVRPQSSVTSSAPTNTDFQRACKTKIDPMEVSGQAERVTVDSVMATSATSWEVHGVVYGRNSFNAVVSEDYKCYVFMKPYGLYAAVVMN